MRKRIISFVLSLAMLLSILVAPSVMAEGAKYTVETTPDGWIKVTQEGGPTLGYSPDSGVTLLEDDGFAFKDLDKDGELDVYEDWRLSDDERAADIASRVDIEQGAGLMLLQFGSSGSAGELRDDVKNKMVAGVRTFANNESTDVALTTSYVNEVQAYAEALTFGIPVSLHSETGISNCTVWPNNLGMAATFDPELGHTRAQWYAKEFRALGITEPNLPQIDTSTDPRYTRYPETFGEDPQLIIDMGQAYVDGMQSTYDEDGTDLGWGEESIIAVIKHFPGNGSGEGGRGRGSAAEYDIYPGDNFYGQVAVFEAAMNTDGLTGGAASVMPKYNVDVKENGDAFDNQNVGANYNSYIMNDLLREELGFDGVVVTDYGITPDGMSTFGVEDITEAERHKILIENNVDIISLGGKMGDGSNATVVMMEAVEMYMAEHGEEATLARLQESAFRITRNMLRLGLFENPYLDTKHSKSVVHCDEAQEDAYEACLKSVILLKNATNLIQSRTKKPTVYIPMIYKPATEGNPWRGTPGKPASIGFLSDARVLGEYFNIVTDTIGAPSGPADESGAPTLQESDIIRKTAEELTGVDFALVLINSPQSDGFNNETKEVLPKTLQYRTYIANGIYVRQTSISGDYITVTRQDTYGAQEIVTRENRSYYGKSVTANNESDLDLVEHVASVCENVVVAVRTDNPFIPAELDAVADSLLLFFNNNMYHTDIGANTNVERALYDVVAGNYEPSGLLPFQMPANMDTVEAQLEDIPRDCESYTDSQGNTYDFTFGLNWSDKIEDERVTKYNVKPLID